MIRTELDEEEGGTRRKEGWKEGQVGRRDNESENMKKLL